MLRAMSDDEKHLPVGSKLAELCDVMDQLLAPDGCPWDREQTMESLQPYLLEEAYEVLEAMEQGNVEEHREELGDLLLQVVFQAALRARERAFDIDDVIAGIVTKLVRRHPHVFGDSQARTADEVHAQWDRIKVEERREKAARGAVAVTDRGSDDARVVRTLAGVPKALPALARAHKLTARAARVGFDWPDISGTWDKVNEELAELREATAERASHADAPDAVEAELGDLLFAAVNLARKLGVDAERALRGANRRFEGRFAYIEDQLHARGRVPAASSLEEMDALWNEAKSIPGA